MLKNKDSDICKLLKSAKTIAVVGISHNPNRISREIANFLISKDYKIVGVNPGISKAGDIIVYPKLSDIPFDINIVNVFRRPETIGELINDVITMKPKVFWLQLGIRNDEAIKPLAENGISVVQDTCIKIAYYDLFLNFNFNFVINNFINKPLNSS